MNNDGMKFNSDVNGNAVIMLISKLYVIILFLFLWGNPCVEISI